MCRVQSRTRRIIGRDHRQTVPVCLQGECCPIIPARKSCSAQNGHHEETKQNPLYNPKRKFRPTGPLVRLGGNAHEFRHIFANRQIDTDVTEIIGIGIKA